MRRIFLMALALPVLGLAARAADPGQPAVVVERDTSRWIPWTNPGRPVAAGSALDASFLLDRPAGRHGFVAAKGDRFVFDDGTEARFWGGNFFGEADFPDKPDAERLADIVARSGANIVRLHHMDVVAPWTDKVVRRSLFGGQHPPTTRRLDPVMLDRLEYLIWCLKQRGVYIFLSHTSSRMVMPGDGFPGPPEAAGGVGLGLKFEGMFDPFLIELQQEYLRQLLTHRNPYTGLALVEDPVLALTEVINENTTLWPQESGPFALASDYHRRMLRSQFNAWLRAMAGTRLQLAERWAQDGRSGLAAGEDPAASTVEIPVTYRDRAKHGYSDARIRDTFAFLAHVQHRYFDEMRRFLKALGVRAAITGSNHWTSDLIDLEQNAAFDYVDRHEYWTHPQGSYNYEKGQGIEPRAMVRDPRGGMIAGLAARRVWGKPFVASEWHTCLPNPFRAEGPPIAAAYAALQGWSMMQYAYWAVTETAPPMINSFEGMFDPAHVNMLPASAMLYHRHDVAPARTAYADRVGHAVAADPLASVARHGELALIAKYGLAFEGVAAPPENDERLVATGRQAPARTPDGALTWDAARGVLTIDTPRSQGVIGFAAGQRVTTAAVTFEITTPFAAVIVTSLTMDPIASSPRVLVSTSADARWTGADVSPGGDEILTTGHWPFLMQVVEGTLTIRTTPGAQVYRLASDGSRLGLLATQPADGGTTIVLSAANRAMHYEVVTRQ